MPKHFTYRILDLDNNVVAEGEASKCSSVVGIETSSLNQYAVNGWLWSGKYRVICLDKGNIEDKIFDLLDLKGDLVFTGTRADIMKKFNFKSSFRCNDYIINNKRLLGKYKVELHRENRKKEDEIYASEIARRLNIYGSTCSMKKILKLSYRN